MPEESLTAASWQTLEQLIEEGESGAVNAFVGQLDPNDTAHTISHLSEEARGVLLKLLDPTLAAGVMEHLVDDLAVEMIEDLPAPAAAAIVDEMDSNDRADILSELDDVDADAILGQLEPQQAEQAKRLAQYDSDTAGGMMATEFLAFDQQCTIDQVLQDLRAHAQQYSHYDVQYLYVVASDQTLKGVVPLRDLVLKPGHLPLVSTMRDKPHALQDTHRLDEVNRLFEHYHLFGLPVVDHDKKLVGVVHRASVEEAIAERSDRTVLKFGGIIGGDELRTMPITRRSTRRLAFLAPNIVLNLIAISVIAMYESTLAQLTTLMIFLPLVSDMSGCSGNQAVAVSMRELSLDLVRPNEVWRTWVREVSVGLINGLVLGTVVGLIAWGYRSGGSFGLSEGHVIFALVVGSALAINCVVAVSIGGTIPLILKRCNVDPALASGPILTTATDMCGFFLALFFATRALPYLA